MPESSDLAMWFTPSAIRGHFVEDDELWPTLRKLTDRQLIEAAHEFLGSCDLIWERFHEWCLLIVKGASELKDEDLPPEGDCWFTVIGVYMGGRSDYSEPERFMHHVQAKTPEDAEKSVCKEHVAINPVVAAVVDGKLQASR